MEKEKKELDVPKILIYVLEAAVLIMALLYAYESLYGSDYTGVYSEHLQRETIKSLITGLQLQKVHEVPFSDITPKMQIYITEDVYFINAYYIEISKGNVIISDGETETKDIIIRTSEEEVLKMIEHPSYAKESLASGGTTIEKVSEDFVLFSKGYPDFEKMISSN